MKRLHSTASGFIIFLNFNFLYCFSQQKNISCKIYNLTLGSGSKLGQNSGSGSKFFVFGYTTLIWVSSPQPPFSCSNPVPPGNRKLLSPDSNLLPTLGQQIPFEIAVGMNGRVWVRARSVKETVCIANAVECAEFMTRQEIAAMCNKLCDVLAGF